MAQQLIAFGGIGTLVETSALQLDAFNAAFKDIELDWEWTPESYRPMLAQAGGVRRILAYAEQHDEARVTVELAQQLHRRKTALFHQMILESGLQLRPGVANLISACNEAEILTAIASTTDLETIKGLLRAGGLRIEDLSLVLHRGDVVYPKPAPDVYDSCLAQLGIKCGDALAIEDSSSGLEAAQAAGVRCLVTPGEFTKDQDFTGAVAVVDDLGIAGPPAELFTGAADEAV